MSEATAAAPQADAPAVTAGQLLRHAREAAGLHVDSVAASLKVPVRKLEALEADRYDLLGDAVFVRALASSVCRHLKVDPQPVLERLPQGTRPRLVPASEGINAPFRPPGDAQRMGWSAALSRPVRLAVGALLVGAVVIALLPGVERPSSGRARTDVTTTVSPPSLATEAVPASPRTPAAPAESPGTLAPPVPHAATDTAHAGSAAPAAGTAPAGSVPASDAASSTPSTGTTQVGSLPAAPPAAAAPAAAPPAAAAAGGVVVFRASGPSWVQVTDARGETVLRRLLEAGESASASGALPLAVTVGSVRTTEVQVRGKPFDLAPLARDNVARFEVR